MSLTPTIQYLFNYITRIDENIIDLHAAILINPIVVSLNEDEIIVLYGLTNELRFIDPYIIKKVCNDITYTSGKHTKFFSHLIKECANEDKERRVRASRYITEFSVFFDKQIILELVCQFLDENDKRIRNRAYKIIKELRLSQLIQTVESTWLISSDYKAVPIIIEHSDIDFIIDHYEDLYLSGYDRLLFRRCIHDEALELYPNLLNHDPILYLYYITCFNKQITPEEIESIFKDNITSENISMLLWSIGKQGRVDLIQYYDNWCKE